METQQIPVDLQKSGRHSDGDPLVSVYERIVLRQAFPKCSCFLNNVLHNSRFVVALKRIRGHRDPGRQVSLRISRSSEQLGVLIDGLVHRCEKRRSPGRFPSFQKIDELLDRLLLFRSQGADEIGKILGGHACLPPRSIPGSLGSAIQHNSAGRSLAHISNSAPQSNNRFIGPRSPGTWPRR